MDPFMPDPKLKEAMEEIKSVLKKYDIGAEVILASETHLEFLHEYSPTWSCARIEKGPDGGYGVRIRSKLEDFPSKKAQKKCMEATVGMFAGILDAMVKSQNNMMVVIAMLGKRFHIEHMSKEEGSE